MGGNSGAPKTALDLDAVHAVLWHFGDYNYGIEPGSFVSRLLVSLSAADAESRARLALGFPHLVAAFEMVQQQTWGFDYLRGLAIAELNGSLVRSTDVTFELAGRDV